VKSDPSIHLKTEFALDVNKKYVDLQLIIGSRPDKTARGAGLSAESGVPAHIGKGGIRVQSDYRDADCRHRRRFMRNPFGIDARQEA
jgi:hypothetical protein